MARVTEGLPLAHTTCATLEVLDIENEVLDNLRPQAWRDRERVLAFIHLQNVPFLPPIKFFDFYVLLHSRELRLQQRLYAIIVLTKIRYNSIYDDDTGYRLVCDQVLSLLA